MTDLNVSLIDRKGILYVDYRYDKKRVRRSLGLKTTKKNEAYAYRYLIPDIEKNILIGIKSKDELKLSHFTNLVLKKKQKQKHNTYALYTNAVKKFFSIVVDKNIQDYKISDIEDYIDELDVCAASIKTYLAPIALAFDIAIKQDLIGRNPVKFADKPRSRNKEREPFSLDEVKSLLYNASGELKLFLYLAFYTGCRSGEILALRWGDITDSKIVISRTRLKNGDFNIPKTGKTREAFLLEPLKTFLDTLECNKAPDELIIKLTYQTILVRFRELLSTLGMGRQGLHITRHTFASILASGGVKPIIIQRLLGHTDLKSTSRYSHYLENDEDRKEVARIMK